MIEREWVPRDDTADRAAEQHANVLVDSERPAVRRQVPNTDTDIGAVVQAKLKVGAAGDMFEREADDVAARVVKSLQSPTVSDEPPDDQRVQRREAAPDVDGDGSDADDETSDGTTVDVGGRLRRIQRSVPDTDVIDVIDVTDQAAAPTRIQRAAPIGAAGGELDDGTSRMLQSSRSGGRPLPDGARSSMEGAFGADFGAVRVHVGSQSRELNDRIQAKAFTTGRDIYFRDGLPDAASPSGQSLLAHELTHTIQQGAASAAGQRGAASRGGPGVSRWVDDIQRLTWPWKKAAPAPPQISGPGTLDSAGSFTENPTNPSTSGISAPTNVHVRSGRGEITKLDSIDPSSRPDPETFRLGDPALYPAERDQVAGGGRAEMGPIVELMPDGSEIEYPPEFGSAPISGTVPGPHQSFPDADELGENDILYPSPSADDVALPTKVELDDDPVAVITAYRHYAGEFLKLAQRHDIKIERYTRYFEADYEAVAVAKQQFETAEAAGDQSTMTKLDKDMGGNPVSEFSYAEFRLERAHIAEAAADREVPLVDGIYEVARDREKQFKGTAGGRSLARTTARVATLRSNKERAQAAARDAASIDASITKHEKRQTELEAAREEGGRLGKLVKQAKMSEDLLKVKRMGLKTDKSAVKKGKGRGVSLAKHLANKGGAGVVGAGTSLLTLGVVNFGQDKDDGGYSSTKRFTPTWTRISDDFRRIKDMSDKRPYGPITSLHVVLEALSTIIKEIRNILASVTVIATLLAFIPPLAPVASAVAGVAGTLALGFAGAKLVIDAILASWSVIERIRNSNARNSDLLSSQAARQGVDVVGDALAVGGAFGGAAVGNAIDGSGTHTATGAAGEGQKSIGGAAAKSATRVGGSLAGQAVGALSTNEEIAATSHKEQQLNHMRQGRRGAQAEMPAGREAATQAVPDGEAPAWLAQAQEDEAAARESSLDALVTVHFAKIKRFHAKTQALMASSAELDAKAPALARGEALDDGEQQEDRRNVAGMAASLRASINAVGQLSGAIAVDDVRAHAGV